MTTFQYAMGKHQRVMTPKGAFNASTIPDGGANEAITYIAPGDAAPLISARRVHWPSDGGEVKETF